MTKKKFYQVTQEIEGEVLLFLVKAKNTEEVITICKSNDFIPGNIIETNCLGMLEINERSENEMSKM